MPIYEYQCESCGHRQDALQKISDPPLTDCAACGAASLRKLVSAPRFRLKGSGWYETDFKQENRRNLAESGDSPGDGAKKPDAGDSAGASGEGASGTGGKAAGGASKSGGDAAAPATKGTGTTGSSTAATGE